MDAGGGTVVDLACRLCGAPSPAIGSSNGHRLHRCPGCGFLFVDVAFLTGHESEVYDGYVGAALYGPKLEKKMRRHSRRIARYRDMAPGRRFLDVGCSLGAAVEAARRQGFDANGIDADAKSIADAKAHFPDCHFRHALVRDLAREGKRFDFIYCTEVVEHVPDPEEFLAGISAIMEPGAVGFFTTPDAGHFRAPKDVLIWDEVKPPEHVGLFNRANFRAALERAGLEVVRTVPSIKPNLKVLVRKP